MDIDVYQPCPCHADKKIKFCCGKDIVGDLNEVLSLNKARQSVAALEHLDRAINKLGPRDCLLTLKTRVLISLNRIDEAEQTNDQFRENNPHHPMGHHHRALVLAAQGDSRQAVDALQDALEAIRGVHVPVSFGNAFRIIGLLLLAEGHVMAARAHLRFAMTLRREDESLKQLFSESWQMPGLPLMLRHEFGIFDAPQEKPWHEQFHQAQVLAGAGRWRRARQLLAELDTHNPDEPEIQRAIAVLSTWLAASNLAADWARYADNPNLEADDAVDAKTYQLLLSADPLTESLKIVRQSVNVSDVNAVLEAGTAHGQFLSSQVRRDPSAEDSSPIPKAGFALLNCETPAEPTTELESIPHIVGEAFLFSKQTDRPGRVELIAVQDEQLDEAMDLVKSALGDWIDDVEEPEVIGEVSRLDHRLKVRLKIPDELTPQKYRELLSKQRKKTYLHDWMDIPFHALHGKTPHEVKGDSAYETTLLALIGLLEQSADGLVFDEFDFDDVRGALELPKSTTVDHHREDFENLSPALQSRLAFDQLEDEQLLTVYVKSAMIGNLPTIRGTAEELLKRPHLAEDVNMAGILLTLAQVSADDETAIDYGRQAREKAVAAGDNEGIWLVHELEIRLERGITEGCDEIIRVLRTRYQGDREVEIRLITALQRFGLIGPQGQIPQLAEAPQPAEATAGESREPVIWTPEQGQAATADKGKSKLWIPE